MRDKVLRKMPQTVTQVQIEEGEDSDSDSSDSESDEAGADEAERMAADGFQATVESFFCVSWDSTGVTWGAQRRLQAPLWLPFVFPGLPL